MRLNAATPPIGGSELRVARQRRSISAHDIAQAIGVTDERVRQIERREVVPGPEAMAYLKTLHRLEDERAESRLAIETVTDHDESQAVG